MASVPSPFGGDDDDTFEPEGAFVPESIPDPGPFLADHDVLAGDEHLDVHATARELFEERGVYDMTFGYNLARLNRDTRHPAAGYRYAVERPGETNLPGSGDRRVLRAEFTPTTPFCPQTHTLTKGSFRAWNADADRHEFDLVRVRTAPMHHQSEDVNDALADLAAGFVETGSVTAGEGGSGGRQPGRGTGPGRQSGHSTGSSPDDAPF